LERCLSGRKGRFAKPLYELKLVPRVRIPPSPLKSVILDLKKSGKPANIEFAGFLILRITRKYSA
jgi:hypothetical protein